MKEVAAHTLEFVCMCVCVSFSLLFSSLSVCESPSTKKRKDETVECMWAYKKAETKQTSKTENNNNNNKRGIGSQSGVIWLRQKRVVFVAFPSLLLVFHFCCCLFVCVFFTRRKRGRRSCRSVFFRPPTETHRKQGKQKVKQRKQKNTNANKKGKHLSEKNAWGLLLQIQVHRERWVPGRQKTHLFWELCMQLALENHSFSKTKRRGGGEGKNW